MKPRCHHDHLWKHWIPRVGWMRMALSALAFCLMLTAPAAAKQFIDNLATDFYAGAADNIYIRHDLDGSLELSPYAALGNWTTTKAPSNASISLASAVTYNGKIYITGGFGSDENMGVSGPTVDNALNKVWYSTVMADGSIGDDWKQEDTSVLPQPTYGHASVVVNRRLYIIGGRSTANQTMNSVYYAKIMGWDGAVKALYDPNTWTAVAPLPVGLFKSTAVTWEGRVYVVGGMDNLNFARDLVYIADVQPNGNINGWRPTSAALPTPLCGHNTVVSNGRIYILGGTTTGQPMDAVSSVYVGTIDPITGDIGAWVATTSLPEALNGAGATICSGKIWVSGGTNSGTAKSSLWFARLDRNTGLIPATGQRDTWSRTTDLPVPVYNHMMVNFNEHLYVMGGVNNSGGQDKIYTSTLTNYKNNITRWVPTTPLFLSSSGGGALKFWTGHTAVLRVPLTDDSFGGQEGAPTIFVVGGGTNTFNAYATGTGDSTPSAYSTIYNSEVNTDGSLKTWEAPDTGGSIPVASILHSSTLVNLTQGNAIYIIGGANSTNAFIWAGAASRSVCAAGQGYVGRASVFYEKVGQASSSGGTGSFEETAPLPILDPACSGSEASYTPNTATPIYHPLIRSRSVSNNGHLYVLGGISRRNIPGWTGGEPSGSEPVFENRIWMCRPNPGGSVNGGLGYDGWSLTTNLPSNLYDFAACVAYNRIYIFGGKTDATGTPVNTVYSIDINYDGRLGTWRAEPSLPFALAEHEVVFTSGRFYIIGGVNTTGALQNAVYYCMPTNDGTIPASPSPGCWDVSNSVLEYGVAGHTAVADNGFIYVLGGRYDPTLPPASSTYMTSIIDIFHAQDIFYSWEGNFERYIDLDSDQLLSALNFDANANYETIMVKCRWALERGPWTDWTLEQPLGPFVINRLARYVHYKIRFATNQNDAGNYRTPTISKIYLDYAASKPVTEDHFQINHNIFDPQVQPLEISFKTRDTQVSNVIFRVYNTEGELIRRQMIELPPNAQLPYSGSWTWDGANENAELVANGVYLIQYNSGDTHKLRKVIVLKR